MPPIMRWLVALLVWVASVAGAVALSNVVATKAKTQQATAPFDAGAVTAADSNSLFHTKNFGKVLGIVRSHVGAGAKFDSLVIYPGYVSMTQVKGTREADVYVAANGRYDITDTGSHIGSDPEFELAAHPRRCAGADRASDRHARRTPPLRSCTTWCTSPIR